MILKGTKVLAQIQLRRVFKIMSIVRVTNYNKFQGQIFDALENGARNRFKPSKDDVAKYFNTVMAINSLPRYTKSFQGESLDDWEITEALAGFVLPSSVTLGSKATDRDLLDRYRVVDVDEDGNQIDVNLEMLDLADFEKVGNSINSSLKKEFHLAKISSLRKDVSLTEDDVYSFKGYMMQTEAISLPIPLVYPMYDEDEMCYRTLTRIRVYLAKQFQI